MIILLSDDSITTEEDAILAAWHLTRSDLEAPSTLVDTRVKCAWHENGNEGSHGICEPCRSEIRGRR